MKGKVIPPSDKEVITVDSLPASSDLSSNYHLFLFPDGISVVEKLNLLLQHEYTSSQSAFNGKIAMYTNGARNNCEVLYSDFTRCKNNAFLTCNVINAYFNLMNEHFEGRSVAFGTTFDGAIINQGRNCPVSKVRKALKYGIDDTYLPMNVNDNHWILVVVHWSRYLFEIYDSLDHKNVDISATFLTLVRKVQKESKISHWQVLNHYHDHTVQRQMDGYSCGYFTCWYAYQLASSGSVGLFTESYQQSIANISLNIFLSFIEGKLVM